MLNFFLSDKESLSQYVQGEFVSFEDVKRRMFLKSREQNPTIPDHLYRLEQEETFREIESLGDIFIKGLGVIACTHLELVENRIYVRLEQQNNWQELLTYFPPLLLQCMLLYKKQNSISKNDKSELHLYFRDYILPNTRYTAIPNARISQLEYYATQQGGLHDLHMHLNGALETDQVWQDYLFNPSGIYEDLKKGFQNPKVKEQLEQESSLLKPLNYVKLLKTAQKLREFFFGYLFPYLGNPFCLDKQILLSVLISDRTDLPGGYKHPFISLISNDDNNYPYLMSVEGLMYILILQELSRNPNELLASLFHFYLLILGLTNRLLVQQIHQNGFEQFQKHTLNELRESSERTYMRRYHQMHGNDLKHIRFLEGRFSPKSTQNEMVRFINTIYKGWDQMKKDIYLIKDRESTDEPELRLIAHFIKKIDEKPDPFIRHKALRYEVLQRGKILSLLLKNHPQYREKVTGVDAAASEFDAEPEVFAPVFRLLRRSGIKHFTYHAGEDFYHILDGLRAIYEAIVFCDLQKGDRIGHATATGLSVDDWAKVIGNQMAIRRGTHIDNLIFSYHMILHGKIEALNPILPFIINEVNNISFQIYNEHYPITILEQAWMMRQCCPLHALESNREDVRLKPIYSDDEWCFMVEKDFVQSRKDIQSNITWKIFQRYHESSFRKKFDEIIKIDPFGVINAKQVELLQLHLLQEMTKKEIIIETLPTSNVRIGFHKNFSSYHLRNWLKWRDEGKSIPPIVVGSDDSGIFATNIYNEYTNIYCTLLNDHNMQHLKIMDIIKKLDEDSRIYRFK